MSMITTAEIMRIAELRDGLVTRTSSESTASPNARSRDSSSLGVLHPVFRGVYASTAARGRWPSGHSRRVPGVPDVVVSDMTAAAHWRLRRTPRDVLEVVVAQPRLVRLPGVRVHRTKTCDEQDVVMYANGLRVTTPARTLFDIAAELDPTMMTSVAEDALNRRLCTPWSLADVARAADGAGPSRRGGVPELVEASGGELPPVGSEAELLLAEALGGAGLPQPLAPVPGGPAGHGSIRLDLAIPADRFDGRGRRPRLARRPVALQRDHARDLLLCGRTAGGCSGSRPRTSTSGSARRPPPCTPGLLRRLISRRLCA